MDEAFVASRNIASFVKALAKSGVDGAAEAREANLDLALRVAKEDPEALALMRLILFAYEAGKQVGHNEAQAGRS